MNRAGALSWLHACMCGHSRDLNLVNTYTLSRRLDRSFEALSRFQNENRLRFQCETLRNRSRRMASNLFVRNKQHAYGSMRDVVFPQQSKSVHRDGDTRLHVEHTRAPHLAVADAKRHLLKCSKFPNRIGMSKEKDWLGFRYPSEIRLHVIAEVSYAVNLRLRAQMFESGSKEIGKMIHGCLAAAGRLNLDQRL